MKAPPRLYVDEPLHTGQDLCLSRDASHYVTSVMRRRVSDDLRLFNGKDGEWRASLTLVDRKAVHVHLNEQIRPFAEVPNIRLLFAPVKKSRSAFIVEKATELGVRSLQCVQTRRTTARPIRDTRMTLISREAAEQTERLDLPDILPLKGLPEVLQDWDADRPLMYCDEAGDDEDRPWGGKQGRAGPMLEVLKKHKPAISKAAILIGPEGGFTPEERRALRALTFVYPVTLGPRVLRADTAAIAALTLWQSICGDWNQL